MKRHFRHRNVALALRNLVRLTKTSRRKLSEELRDLEIAESHISKLRNVLIRGLSNRSLHGIENLSNGAIRILFQIIQIEIIPKSSHASAQVLLTNVILRRAVAHVSIMMSIARSHHVDVDISGKIREHGSRMASLHEPHPLTVQLLLVRSLKSTDQSSRANIITTNTNDIITTMVNEISEHSILRSSIQYLRILLTSRLFHSLSVSRKNSQEHFLVDFVISVINMIKASIFSPITISVISRISENHSRIRVIW
ncbi:uncharacterized protein [Blastocystis hominis]|uniref:Uncharacterized protein n=1 Tax=Blastocystis hominis TaxID=12968 RepID=D8M350_BLAHO|nr:uncharacterized protein [Blastocystis hominis]CBK22773.2 unnamed protein product [Blastocystis hominis]|eukprot:XP_012896821.1 uncharacterized protein [Blastocystis hominis]